MCGSPVWQVLGAQACAGLSRPEQRGPVEIVNVCGSPAWQASGGRSAGDRVGLRGGSLGECGPGRLKCGPKIGDPMACRAAVQWAYGAGLGVQRRLFF
jgi:hypothetical protein